MAANKTLTVSPTSTNGGSVTLAYNSATSNNVATYTPLPGFSGLDRFSYTVSDGRGGTAGVGAALSNRGDGHFAAGTRGIQPRASRKCGLCN